jgi:hypothetical protein
LDFVVTTELALLPKWKFDKGVVAQVYTVDVLAVENRVVGQEIPFSNGSQSNITMTRSDPDRAKCSSRLSNLGLVAL